MFFAKCKSRAALVWKGFPQIGQIKVSVSIFSMGSWLGKGFFTSGEGETFSFVSGGSSGVGLTNGKSGSVMMNQKR